MEKVHEVAQRVAHRLHKKLGSSPLINFLLGAASLGFWACASIVQIQTSEYLALGNQNHLAGVAWGIVQQPGLLITGQAPIQYATAWIYAWVVELVTLIFALVLTQAVLKISQANPHLAKWFVPVGILLILLNGFADFSSSPGWWLIQLLIAAAVGGIVVIGLPLGRGDIPQDR